MKYSQSDEERVILDYFNGQTGTFLDIGANDGQTFSNTRALAERGWRGVMVEPSPKAFARLEALYAGHKGFYLYQVAIGDHNGKAILQESGQLCGIQDVALVSTFSAEEMKRFNGATTYEPVEVKMFKWKTFRNRLTIKDFDFISIDVESSELQILPHIDLSKTQLLCIEHNGSSSLKSAYLNITSKHGLSKIIYESGENIIICR